MTLDPTLVALGWDEDRAARFPADEPGVEPARAVELQRGFVRVRAASGAWLAPIPRALRRGSSAWPTTGPPATGDWLAVEPGGAIRGILPRRSALRRFDETAGDETLVANVDLAIVVTSLNRDLNLGRIERLLAIADEAAVPRLLALSKSDLFPDPEVQANRFSAQLGVQALPFSSRTGAGLDDLRARMLPRRTTVLIGSSGVGKSTLVNTLVGSELQKTLEIRSNDDQGRHATTSRTLLTLPGGALVVDTPGLRSPRPASAAGLRKTFHDVYRFADACQFADCSHGSEPSCAVRDALATCQLALRRLESLRKLERELAYAAEARGDYDTTSRGMPAAPKRSRR